MVTDCEAGPWQQHCVPSHQPCPSDSPIWPFCFSCPLTISLAVRHFIKILAWLARLLLWSTNFGFVIICINRELGSEIEIGRFQLMEQNQGEKTVRSKVQMCFSPVPLEINSRISVDLYESGIWHLLTGCRFIHVVIASLSFLLTQWNVIVKLPAIKLRGRLYDTFGLLLETTCVNLCISYRTDYRQYCMLHEAVKIPPTTWRMRCLILPARLPSLVLAQYTLCNLWYFKLRHLLVSVRMKRWYRKPVK